MAPGPCLVEGTVSFARFHFQVIKIKECETVPKNKKLLRFVLDDGVGTDCVIFSGIHEYL